MATVKDIVDNWFKEDSLSHRLENLIEVYRILPELKIVLAKEINKVKSEIVNNNKEPEA